MQSVAGNLPEVSMSSLSGSKPCVLQLFVTPKRGQSVNVIAQYVAAVSGRRGEIEQRAIGVKYTSLHTAKWRNVRHLISEPCGDVGEPLW